MLLSQLMKLNYLVISPTPPHTDAAPHPPPPHTQTQHHNFFRSLASFIDMSYSTASEFLKSFSNSVSAPGSFHLFGTKCNMFWFWYRCGWVDCSVGSFTNFWCWQMIIYFIYWYINIILPRWNICLLTSVFCLWPARKIIPWDIRPQ